MKSFEDYCNEPVFPVLGLPNGEMPLGVYPGITRLEYFTAKALQPLLATVSFPEERAKVPQFALANAIETLRHLYTFLNPDYRIKHPAQ